MAVDVHVADSLTGLLVPAVRDADSIADLGSGAGFPGLVLAVALPAATVTLVESVGRKAAFLADAAARWSSQTSSSSPARAEEWADGRDTQAVVTARALAPLTALVEYAAPLLRHAGVLVAWKGPAGAGEDAGRRSRGVPARDVRARPSSRCHRTPRAGHRPAVHSICQLEGQPHARRLPTASGNGPQTADPSLNWSVRDGSEPNSWPPAPTEPAGSFRRDGNDLRDRQPEGGRGEDDDGRQRRCLHRGGGLPDDPRRRRPAGQCDRRARPAEARRAEPLRRSER